MRTYQNKIILLGGGGHAKVLIDLIRALNKYEITGILDPHLDLGILVSGISVLGGDNILTDLYKKNIKNVCVSVGTEKDTDKRKKLYEKVKQLGFAVPSLVHPNAVVSKESKISEGTQIMAGAIIQTNSSVGENTILNTTSVIEHDCNIGKHVHICPGAIISGGSSIGEGVFIGANATVIQGIKIGNKAKVAAGAVVINDIEEKKVVKGVPAV